MPAPTTVIKYRGANYGLFLNNISAPAGDLTHLLPKGNENGPFGLVGTAQEIVCTSTSNLSAVLIKISGYDALGYLREVEVVGPNNSIVYSNRFLKNIISVSCNAPVTNLSIGVGARGTTDLILLSPYREAPYNLIDVSIGDVGLAQLNFTYDFMYTPDQFRAILPPGSQHQDPNSPFGPFSPLQLDGTATANISPNYALLRCITFQNGATPRPYNSSQTYNSPGPLATALWIKFNATNIPGSPVPFAQPQAEITFMQAGSYTC